MRSVQVYQSLFGRYVFHTQATELNGSLKAMVCFLSIFNAALSIFQCLFLRLSIIIKISLANIPEHLLIPKRSRQYGEIIQSEGIEGAGTSVSIR